MRKLSAFFILGLVLGLVRLLPLHAQETANAPVGANTTTANQMPPTGLAPDDVMKKISELVRAGKYAEAQQGVAALLILYPDDQRLIKGKALLDKTLASPQPAPPTASSHPLAANEAPTQPATNDSHEPRAGSATGTATPLTLKPAAPVAQDPVPPVTNPSPPAAASNTAILHIYRPHHLTAAAQQPYIYVDGKKITPIANSQTIRMLLSPGKHNISVSKKYIDNQIPINDLDMASGNEYWIRVDISAGAFGAHSKLYLVPTDQALTESKKTEEIRIGDVSLN